MWRNTSRAFKHFIQEVEQFKRDKHYGMSMSVLYIDMKVEKSGHEIQP